MRIESHHPARFDRSSPVLRHWLANSEGFRVRTPRGGGVVVKVYGLPGAPTAVAVQRRIGRRLIVPADAFSEVVPAQRLLVVETSLREASLGRRRPPRQLVLRGARAAAVGAARAGGHTRPVAARGARLTFRAAIGLARISRVFAVEGAGLGRRAARALLALARAARPHVVRFSVSAAHLVGRGAARTAAARREAQITRSLEALIAELGLERSGENGHSRAAHPDTRAITPARPRRH